jgi:hypothetical protein
MWKNIVEPDRPQMTTWRMRISCWIPKAKKTLSEYIILIAFPQLQWLHESVSTLRIRTLPVLLLVEPRPNVDQGRLILEVSRSHKTTQHSR